VADARHPPRPSHGRRSSGPAAPALARARRARYIRSSAETRKPDPSPGMEKLFLHMGVFAAITAVVAAVCFWFVAQDEKKSKK
jgi:hypothetical protein